MKSIVILVSFIPSIISFFIWNRDGMRVAFWKTSVERKIEVPIIEGMAELGTQTQIIWDERFVSGIETPVGGVVATLILLLFLFLGFRKKAVSV